MWDELEVTDVFRLRLIPELVGVLALRVVLETVDMLPPAPLDSLRRPECDV